MAFSLARIKHFISDVETTEETFKLFCLKVSPIVVPATHPMHYIKSHAAPKHASIFVVGGRE